MRSSHLACLLTSSLLTTPAAAAIQADALAVLPAIPPDGDQQQYLQPPQQRSQDVELDFVSLSKERRRIASSDSAPDTETHLPPRHTLTFLPPPPTRCTQKRRDNGRIRGRRHTRNTQAQIKAAAAVHTAVSRPAAREYRCASGRRTGQRETFNAGIGCVDGG